MTRGYSGLESGDFVASFGITSANQRAAGAGYGSNDPWGGLPPANSRIPTPDSGYGVVSPALLPSSARSGGS
jgi:hypothetical protein